jgi:hypothetical protein
MTERPQTDPLPTFNSLPKRHRAGVSLASHHPALALPQTMKRPNSGKVFFSI